jgi:hypothetical protein
LQIGVLLLSICLSQQVMARVFNMKSETIGSYLLFSTGGSLLKDQAYVNESVADKYDAEVSTNNSGEFGFFFGSTYATFGFGMEIIQPTVIKEMVAKQSGSRVYLVDSTVQVYTPKAFIDFNLHTGSLHRIFIRGYAGSATAQVKNVYSNVTLTAGAHTVEMKGAGALYGGGAGVEYFMMDTTTFVLQADYRILKIQSLKYSKDVTTFSGAKSAGDTVTDTSDTKRELDFSGALISAGFRFYF